MRSKSTSWAVERRVFPQAEEERLVRTLTARGIDFLEFTGHEFRNHPDICDAAVARGSCYFVREMSAARNWQPQLWGRPEDFACSHYFPRFTAGLLNGMGRFMSVGELGWTLPQVTAELGDAQGRLFVRPDDGFKSFEGGLISAAEFDQWTKGLSLLQVPNHTRILVARPEPLLTEWRLQVIRGRAVAGSQYKPIWKAEVPRDVVAFAEQAHRTAKWELAAYVMDIALTNSGLKIVEIGSILCVAFYEADCDAIVDALQEVIEA